MVFDPLTYDFAAEGGGSRRAKPIVLPRPNYGVAGPSGAIFRDVVQQGARDPRPRPPGGPAPASFEGVTNQGPFRYDPVLPALTPQQQRALMERRRLATRSYEETEATVSRERARANADNLRQQSEVARNQQLQSRAGMQTLAGRGVARGPMFVNPFQRRLVEESQRQVGELSSGLANTLAQLQSALQQAGIARDREYAQIDFDAVDFRSDIPRLLGA